MIIMVVHQVDVKSACLHAPIDCELYLEPPQGLREGNEDKAVWKLNKPIYRLLLLLLLLHLFAFHFYCIYLLKTEWSHLELDVT